MLDDQRWTSGDLKRTRLRLGWGAPSHSDDQKTILTGISNRAGQCFQSKRRVKRNLSFSYLSSLLLYVFSYSFRFPITARPVSISPARLPYYKGIVHSSGISRVASIENVTFFSLSLFVVRREKKPLCFFHWLRRWFSLTPSTGRFANS